MMITSANISDYRSYYINDTTTTIPVGAVRVTFFGTSTLLFDDGKTQIMIDGFFSRPPLLNVLLSKLKTNTGFVNDVLLKYGIDKLKGIFVSHSHYDHALDVAYVTKVTNATLYGSSSTINIGRGEGLGEIQMSLFEPGKEISIGEFTVTILKAKHSQLPGKFNDVGIEITQPLKQPAMMKEYKEGGSFDICIKHGEHIILIKPSCNYIKGALDYIKADVFFLNIAGLTRQDSSFQTNFYEQTVKKTKPGLVIPVHWDNFFKPLSGNLKAYPKIMKDVKGDFNYMIKRTKADEIDFRILQGYKSILLFPSDIKQTQIYNYQTFNAK